VDAVNNCAVSAGGGDVDNDYEVTASEQSRCHAEFTVGDACVTVEAPEVREASDMAHRIARLLREDEARQAYQGTPLEDDIGELRGIEEEVCNVSQRLNNRLNSGDIPWDAGSEIAAEFCWGGEIGDVAKRLKAVTERIESGRSAAQVTPAPPVAPETCRWTLKGSPGSYIWRSACHRSNAYPMVEGVPCPGCGKPVEVSRG